MRALEFAIRAVEKSPARNPRHARIDGVACRLDIFPQGAVGHVIVLITSSWSPSSSGTKPHPPHVGHRCSSSAPFSMTPSPLQSGQVFMCASSLGIDFLQWKFLQVVAEPPTITARDASASTSCRCGDDLLVEVIAAASISAVRDSLCCPCH